MMPGRRHFSAHALNDHHVNDGTVVTGERSSMAIGTVAAGFSIVGV
jgi:hypothetical protein